MNKISSGHARCGGNACSALMQYVLTDNKWIVRSGQQPQANRGDQECRRMQAAFQIREA